MDFVIEEWSPGHPRWDELGRVIEEQGQANWAFGDHHAEFPHYFLAALVDGEVAGFLMFVVWEIGPHDRKYPAVQRDGVTLKEAKIFAFGVQKAYRRQGISRALQERALVRAKGLNCYQVRSTSNQNYPESHQLKLSMGFAVEPMERDEPWLTFIMPLQAIKLDE